MEFGALIEEFVVKTVQRKNIFGLPSLVRVYEFFTIFGLLNHCVYQIALSMTCYLADSQHSID